MSFFSRVETAAKAALPIHVAMAATAANTATAPLSQADRIEDKLDYLIAKLRGTKTVSVGVSSEDIAELHAKLKTVSDAVASLANPPVVVAPVVAPPVVVATPAPTPTV